MDDLDDTAIPWGLRSDAVPPSPAMRAWVDVAHATLFLELLAGPTALQRRYDALREELRRYTAAAVTSERPSRKKSRPAPFNISASLGVR